jgi:phage terminase Nu1 subunit (DNA packaging protein)
MSTANESAKHIFLGISRFRDLIGSGAITRQKSGRYKLDVVREEYCLHMQKIAAGRGADGGAALSEQRSRLAGAQAERAEFENVRAMGGFVELEVFKRQLVADLMTTRERALSTPGKISDSLTPYTPKDRDAIHEIVKREIYEMLEDLSNPPAYVDKVIEGQKDHRQ